jgi:hypothetical protein
MQRQVEPEWLDTLPSDDPGAIGSRRDLQKLNAWMGNARMMARALNSMAPQRAAASLVELGAGDGNFMAEVVDRLEKPLVWNRITLVDRQQLVPVEVCAELESSGGSVAALSADAFDWLGSLRAELRHVMATNLFLHHFADDELQRLFALVAPLSEAFVAVEPSRSAFALGCSYLVGVIGCNHVTRHDAPVSVRAGFQGTELSRLWPAGSDWVLEERNSGLFSHLFVARRRS